MTITTHEEAKQGTINLINLSSEHRKIYWNRHGDKPAVALQKSMKSISDALKLFYESKESSIAT